MAGRVRKGGPNEGASPKPGGLLAPLNRIETRNGRNLIDFLPFSTVPVDDILDGTVSVSQYLQQAIDTVAAEGGGVVNIDVAGTYSITETITVPNNVSIAGNRSATLKAAATLADSAPVLSNEDVLTGNSNISISGIIIDANKAERPTSAAAALRIIVAISGGGSGTCENIAIQNNEIKNSNYIGIQVTQCQAFSVTNNYIHDCERDGLQAVYSCQDGVITGNVILDCDDDGIGLNAENVPLKDVTGDMLSGEDTITNVSGSTSAVQIGDSCKIVGAGVAGADLISIVTGKTSNTIELTDTASTTVSGSDVSVGTVGHEMLGLVVSGNVISGGPNGGGSIGAYGVKDSSITGNCLFVPYLYGICVSNWNTTSADRLTITGNTIYQAGLENSGDGHGIIVRSSRSVSSDGGYAGCDDILIHGNLIYDSRYNGIRVLGDTPTGTTITNCRITDNIVLNSGATGSKQPGIVADVATDLTVSNNTSKDTQVTKTQSIGISLSNITGTLTVVGNDCEGNDTAGTAGRISFSSLSAVTKISVYNNVGFEPWAGNASASGTWSSLSVGAATIYYKDIAITYGVSFPSNPIVLANSLHTGIAASPVSITTTGFTLRLWSTGNPGTGLHSGAWHARATS